MNTEDVMYVVAVSYNDTEHLLSLTMWKSSFKHSSEWNKDVESRICDQRSAVLTSHRLSSGLSEIILDFCIVSSSVSVFVYSSHDHVRDHCKIFTECVSGESEHEHDEWTWPNPIWRPAFADAVPRSLQFLDPTHNRVSCVSRPALQFALNVSIVHYLN